MQSSETKGVFTPSVFTYQEWHAVRAAHLKKLLLERRFQTLGIRSRVRLFCLFLSVARFWLYPHHETGPLPHSRKL